MRVARKVWKKRSNLDLGRTIPHACHIFHVALAIHFPQIFINGQAIAVRQACLHLRDVLVRQREIGGNDSAHVQDIGDNGIDLFSRQRFWRRPWHGAIDVVPKRGYFGKLHQRRATRRGMVRQRRNPPILNVSIGCAADNRRENFVRLAKRSVARRALVFPNRFAL